MARREQGGVNVLAVNVRKFMAREWEHVKRFLSHKDPNYILGFGTCSNYAG